MFLYTFPCVSFRDMKETGAFQQAGFTHAQRYTPREKHSAARINVGHTQQKLPVFTAISCIIADCALTGTSL